MKLHSPAGRQSIFPHNPYSRMESLLNAYLDCKSLSQKLWRHVENVPMTCFFHHFGTLKTCRHNFWDRL